MAGCSTNAVAISGTGPGGIPGNSITVIDLKNRTVKATFDLGNYNFSKTLQNIETTLIGSNDSRPLDIYNLRLEKSIADDDQTHKIRVVLGEKPTKIETLTSESQTGQKQARRS